jgi:hypothetical protein
MSMSSRANPRLAKLAYWRNGTRPLLVAQITEGPQSELNRTVHIPVTKADLVVLKAVVARLEGDA